MGEARWIDLCQSVPSFLLLALPSLPLLQGRLASHLIKGGGQYHGTHLIFAAVAPAGTAPASANAAAMLSKAISFFIATNSFLPLAVHGDAVLRSLDEMDDDFVHARAAMRRTGVNLAR